MRKTKKYYVDSQNMMIHSVKRYSSSFKELIEKQPIPFHAKLKLTGLGWLNNGVLFYLEDKNGVNYVMNDVMMHDCIKGTDIFIEGKWDFYQQGTSYSIGLIDKTTTKEENNNERCV